MEDQNLSTISKNLYVDFYDGRGKVLQQTVAPLFQSSAKGSFSIPKDYQGNHILVRAYTRWMLNFDTAFIYSRWIQIYQPPAPDSKKNKLKDVTKPQVFVQLYPEGGFAIQGLTNHFAFSAINAAGKPVAITAIITRNGQTVDSVRSLHDGMGSFSLRLDNTMLRKQMLNRTIALPYIGIRLCLLINTIPAREFLSSITISAKN